MTGEEKEEKKLGCSWFGDYRVGDASYFLGGSLFGFSIYNSLNSKINQMKDPTIWP